MKEGKFNTEAQRTQSYTEFMSLHTIGGASDNDRMV